MQKLKRVLESHLEEIMAEQGLEGQSWKQMLVVAREPDQGDVALPCFSFASVLKKSPNEIAERLCKEIESYMSQNSDFKKSLLWVKAVNGYLNFMADPSWIAEQIFSRGFSDDTGRGEPSGEKVLIEHTSANPNGPFHVGRARNAILGDTLVRLHRLHGDEVRAEYYVDDMGKQVGILSWALNNLEQDDVERILSQAGIEAADQRWATKQDHQSVRWYQAANVLKSTDPDIDSQVGELVRLSEEGDESVLKSFRDAYQPVLDGMLETLSRLGIEYDTFTEESRFVIDGSVSEVMSKLENSTLHDTAENGAHYLELESKGIQGKSTRFYFRRGDGSSLYATRDVAYHQWKWDQCDRLINVLGEDHKLQSKQVSIALEEVGLKAPEVVFYAFIKLPEGKMSTRKANVVFMDDLLDEADARALQAVRELRGSELDEERMQEIATAVASSAVRFNIINVAPEKGFTFRWEDALNFEGDSAPFLMYSHTRACAIGRRIGDEGHDIATLIENGLKDQVWTDLPESGSLVSLLRALGRHHDAIASAVNSHRPHLFAGHLLHLASSFNGFYRDHPVLKDGQINLLNLLLCEVTRRYLATGCEALGIVPIEEM